MELKINATDIRWWFWAVTLAFIVASVAGWNPGYYVVMGISAVQVIFFLAQEKKPGRISGPDSGCLFCLYPLRVLARSAVVYLYTSSVGNCHGGLLRALQHRPCTEVHALESGA
jgi:hypothetical protein